MENICTFASMYTLKEWLKLTIGNEPYEGWDGKMFCSENDLAMTQKTNVTQGFAACYSFTLVTCGWLRMRYNDRELMIQKDDLYLLPCAIWLVWHTCLSRS